jgi:hypothetical protein
MVTKYYAIKMDEKVGGKTLYRAFEGTAAQHSQLGMDKAHWPWPTISFDHVETVTEVNPHE